MDTVEKEVQVADLRGFSTEGLHVFQLHQILWLVLKLMCSGLQIFKEKKQKW